MTPKFLPALLTVFCLSGSPLEAETFVARIAGENLTLTEVFHEDFSGGLDRWLIEGDARVTVREGRLEVDATSGTTQAATIWCRTEFEGSQLVEYDVRLMGGSIQSNINMFLMAAHGGDGDLLETSRERDGGYGQYHEFPNYLVTILNGDGPDKRERLRLRMRLNPGFELADERWFEPLAFGRVYRVACLIRPPLVTVLLDDVPLIRTLYREQLDRGRHGLRIWHTHSLYDNFRVSRIIE